MLILSDVECNARSSHYFSFFFSFVSKRLTDFFSFCRWTLYAILITLLNDVEASDRLSKIVAKVVNVDESAIINKQLRILLRILLINLYAFAFQTSCCFAIFHLFNILLSLHSSIRSNNSLWRCFWHDSIFHAS